MANSNSGKHARKVTLDAAVSNAIAKAVDARKVAAFTVGAAGVLAGAAFAFGATPAMAAETSGTPDTKQAAVAADKQPGADKKAEAGKNADGKPEVKENEAKEAAKNNQAEEKSATGEKTDNNTLKKADKTNNKSRLEQNLSKEKKASTQSVAKTDGKTDGTETEQKTVNTEFVDNKATDSTTATDKTNVASSTTEKTTARKRAKRALENNQPDTTESVNQDRASNGTESQDLNKIKPAAQADGSTKIEINENNADTMPNAYAWGSSDNTYSVDGEKHTVTFHFAAPKDGSKITSIAIFPSKTNGFNNEKSERGIDFYSKNLGKHQSYSGEYIFAANPDGSATLTMSTLFRDGNLNGGAEKYTASRSIFVYVTNKDGKEDIAYKTNVFRTVTLVPPKTSGSVVLKYNEQLTPEKVQAAITEAGNVETARSDKKSVNDQLSGAFTQNINVKSDDAYDKTTFDAINAKKAGDTNSYVAGAKTLNTYMVTDLGFKSGAIPLTVARYDDRIDKPIVEDTDPSKVSDEVKADIKRKLARLNNVSLDQVTINDKGEFTINFAGVDPKDAPKIALRDLVLKKLEEKDISVPAESTATVIYNPLAYNDAEIARIKKAIYEANKDNPELGLSATGYENQISLEYLKGNLTATGDSNKGISNGQAENTITVKIKTDKAVAEFKSNVKAHKLTRLADIRKDYNVSWKQNKIDGRDSDEGLSWSEDGKTIIYRYDPTAAKEFDTNKILNLLKATPKDPNSGLRDLTGNEKLDHEGVDGKGKKSHVGYVIKDDQPTTELSLGNMSGAYWQYSQKVDNSGVDLGDNLSEAGSYSWDNDAKPVFVAAKKDKVYKARLFVLPYGLTMYRNVYMENGNQPWNTPKAINVIFVPQTNHKTSDLKKSVDDHKTVAVEGKDVPTQHEYYNASDKVKSDYDDALKVAKALYEQVKDKKESDLTEKQKADIDNATIRLDKARKALDGDATKKEDLQKSIDENGKAAEGANPASGTQATDRYKNVTDPDFKDASGNADTKKNEAAKKAKEDYDKALEEAKALKDDKNATQKAVDDAKAKLDAAREKLNEFSTNKEKLNAAIAEHGKVNTGKATETDPAEKLKTADPAYQNATKEERKAYDEAVKKANDLSADPNASQKEVNEAITALEAAKKALDAKATDKSQLITAEKLSFDNPDPTNAAGKKSTFYKNAFDKQTSGADDQEKQAAKTAVENYDNALAKAREVLKNYKATQKEVDDAKEALTNAEKVLHEKYASNADELTKVLADNFSGYLMPAYFNAFDKAQAGDADAKKAFKDYNDAYQKAKELKKALEDAKTAGTAPAQNLIDEAKTALEEARKVIDKYATNTSRLSAAVFNDIAIKLSPAYKNVSADDASADAKAAKQKYDDAVTKLHQALNKQMPKDQADGKDIPDTNTPVKDGNLDDKDYLKNIQAHAQGEPLDRDITKILKEMNDAIADLNKFATKTDELLKSVNEDAATHQNPAFKNASHPDYKNESGQADTDKNGKASKAVDDYGAALNKAKELLKKPDATQKEVDEALKALNEKRAALDAYNTDTTKLKDSVDKHGSTDGAAPTEGTQTSDAYRNASDPHFMKADATDPTKLVEDTERNNAAKEAKKAYDEALTKAQELLKKHDSADTPQDAKPTQKDVNDALKTLDDARKTLEDNYKTVTTDLEKEINKSTAEHAPAVTENDFENTPEFQNADAKKKDGADGNKVDNDDVKAYKDALAKARKLAQDNASQTLSDHPTQKQIDDALEALKKAKQNIVDGYKTDVEKLKQAKEYADGAFKNTPEYKNATAVKNDNNNAKHEQAGKDLDGNDQNPGLSKLVEKITAKLQDASKMTQKEVDALVKQLVSAQRKITDNYKTNVDKLNNEVGDKDQDGKPVTPKFEESIPYKNALEKKNAGDTDATSKLKDYNEKLKAAQDLIAQVNSTDPNADPDKKPTQAQVDAALKALQDAKKAIKDSFTTKVDALKKETKELKEDGQPKDEKDKFEKSTEYQNALNKKSADGKDIEDVQTYKAALEKANKLLELFGDDGNPKADIPAGTQIPTQQEVDEAQKALKEIKDKILKNYVTSPHDLQQEVDKSKDGNTDTSTDVFENTPEFKNADAKKDEGGKDNTDMAAYNKALADAKALLDKFDRKTGKPKDDLPAGEKAPTQKQLDDALDALKAAKKKITDSYKTDPSKLKSEADADGDFTKTPEYQNAQAKGDDASKQALEAYKKALEDANKVLGDKNATQAQVDEALKKLQDAKSKLTDSNKTDKSGLQSEADADAKFRDSVFFMIGMSEDIDAYNGALAEAKRVLNDPNATQAQVDAALRKLQDAKDKINHPFGIDSGVGSGSGSGSAAGFETTDSQSASVDKTALRVEVNNSEADSSAASKANTAAARAYVRALAEAKRVLADKNATQAQVDAALKNLKAAKATLRNASGNASGLAKTGAATGLFASLAAVFSGLGVAGVASRRRKHSNE